MPPKKKKAEDTGPKYRGVYPNRGQFKARIYGWESDIYLGHYWNPEKAAQAYDIACIKLRGVFGARHWLNFPVDGYILSGKVDEIMEMDMKDFLAYMHGQCDTVHPRIMAKDAPAKEKPAGKGKGRAKGKA